MATSGYAVYTTDENELFSVGVKRPFGENCLVTMADGEITHASVMPLLAFWKGLKRVGVLGTTTQQPQGREGQ